VSRFDDLRGSSAEADL